jgi:hypothetical protein
MASRPNTSRASAGRRIRGRVARLTRHLRFWMVGVVVALTAVLGVIIELPGWAIVVVYGTALAFFVVVMIAVIDREGGPMGDRGDFQHGRDIHGHYR